MYTRIIKEMDPEAEVVGKACPLFVPLVEEGFAKHHVTEEVIDIYLREIRDSEVDTMILGCTHYRYCVLQSCVIWEIGYTL